MADAGRGPPPNQNEDKQKKPSKKPRHLTHDDLTSDHLTHAQMMLLLAPPVSMTPEESRSFVQLSEQLSAQYEKQFSLDPVVLSRPVHSPIGPLTAAGVAGVAGVADMRQPVTDPKRYPIVKLVGISVTHGSAVGQMDCTEVEMRTVDFRRVFFFGNPNENIRFADFEKLFSSLKKPFKPDGDMPRFLLGMDRPKCRYEEPNLYLPPIVFTLEPSSDEAIFDGHNLPRTRLMGLYLYIFRQNPADKSKIFIQKLKVANYDDFDKGNYITYSIIFAKYHKYIKANDELRRFMRWRPGRLPEFSPLTVGFFCCRGSHLRKLYPQSPMALIRNPYTCPLPKIRHFTTSADVIFSEANVFPRLFLHTMQRLTHLPSRLIAGANRAISNIHSRGSKQYYCPLEYLKEEHVQPLFRGTSNMWWQSCLYNLLFFFKIISRESADALASVATQQQVEQLSTGVRLVSGESTEQAIRILNGLIPSNIAREFIVQRSPIPLGIYKILSVLCNLQVRNTDVVFVKVYSKEFVPTAPHIPSEIGHWVAIVRFGDTNKTYYVCVQTNQYIELDLSNAESILRQMNQLFASYVVMDLLYMVTLDRPYFAGPDVLNLQLPTTAQPAASSDSESDGGMRRHRHVVSKKRKSKSNSKSKTRTKKIV